MVDWQVTATTIFCDAVGEEVTLLVFKDMSAKCTGSTKHAATQNGKNRRVDRKCEGKSCSRLTQYRDKVFTEKS